jgi:hypothetical protein
VGDKRRRSRLRSHRRGRRRPVVGWVRGRSAEALRLAVVSRRRRVHVDPGAHESIAVRNTSSPSVWNSGWCNVITADTLRIYEDDASPEWCRSAVQSVRSRVPGGWTGALRDGPAPASPPTPARRSGRPAGSSAVDDASLPRDGKAEFGRYARGFPSSQGCAAGVRGGPALNPPGSGRFAPTPATHLATTARARGDRAARRQPYSWSAPWPPPPLRPSRRSGPRLRQGRGRCASGARSL